MRLAFIVSFIFIAVVAHAEELHFGTSTTGRPESSGSGYGGINFGANGVCDLRPGGARTSQYGPARPATPAAATGAQTGGSSTGAATGSSDGRAATGGLAATQATGGGNGAALYASCTSCHSAKPRSAEINAVRSGTMPPPSGLSEEDKKALLNYLGG